MNNEQMVSALKHAADMLHLAKHSLECYDRTLKQLAAEVTFTGHQVQVAINNLEFIIAKKEPKKLKECCEAAADQLNSCENCDCEKK